jgi:hypothetical protein
MEYTDRSLRTPERAEQLTGMSVAGVVPDLSDRSEAGTLAASSALDHLIRTLRIELNAIDSPAQPRTIAVVSANPKAGKSQAGESVVKRLAEEGYSAAFRSHDAADSTAQPENVVEMPDFTFQEVASLLHHPTPLSLVKSSDLVLFVSRADSVWGKAEMKLVAMIERVHGRKPLLVVNGVKPDRLEDLLGEMPKPRNRARQFVKRIAQLQFNS